MLEGIRVLEISSRHTMLAGSILADLGAEVVVVEPPGGADGRRLEPFLDARPGLERSLTWQALNRNKLGVTLNTNTVDGVELLRSLAQKFDVFLEATPVGAGATIGETLGLNADAIHCVVRPFHPDGPKAHYATTDLVLMAASGSLGMMGDADRPPVPLPVPQAMMEAGAEAASAVLAALYARDTQGIGQQTTVLARIAAMASAFSTPVMLASGNPEPSRGAGAAVPTVYPCADGFVVASIAFGSAWGPMTNRLAAWAAEEGFLPGALGSRDWSPLPLQLQTGEAEPAHLQQLVTGVSGLFAAKTKAEIWREARARGLLVAPAMDMSDIARSPQFAERGLWNEITWDSRPLRVPARFAQFSDYSIETRRLAPKLAEHTVDVLSRELGLSDEHLQALFIHGVI